MRQSLASRKTKIALFLSGLLGEPLVALIAMLPFILRKDLGASVYQIALFTMLKPVVALFSFYWGASLWRNRQWLKANWIGSWLLAPLPFLFFPWIDSVWLFIAGAAVFLFFQRGGMPAQMEILKQNVPPGARESFFSWSSALNFLGGAFLGLFIGKWMDASNSSWKLIFFMSATVGLLALIFQTRVPVKKFAAEKSIKSSFLTPWKDSWALLKTRPDFGRFQIGFMWGGVGLMMIMPALVLYSADTLGVSHDTYTMSRLVWMGLGFIAATPFWKRKISLAGIYKTTGIACLFFTLSALAWILAGVHINWFFVAFFLYGVAQAGSHLIWYLSGPLFAGNGDSSLFSTVNILTVGLRGLIVPFMASLLCESIGPLPVIIMGALCCLTGSIYLFAKSRKEVEDVAF
jgi:MFS family permease